MSLLQMSISGGVLILAVIVLRALTLHRLPKRTFLALWAVAVLRLLVPFSLPSPASIYTLAERWAPEETIYAEPNIPTPPATEVPVLAGVTPAVHTPAEPPVSPPEEEESSPLGWRELYLAGALLCGLWFLTAYLRCHREFRTALPVEDERLIAALHSRRLRRKVALRQSDRISAPLTYGVLRPVILLPAHTDWSNEARLIYVLEHELTHIRRFDALTKLVLALTACVHWFNPLVWCMYVLANRDIELSCDEAVLERLGVDRRSEYAMTLITMEARKSGLGPFASAFSKNAIEERITAIMKMKKRSLAAIFMAIVLICSMSAVFATSAAEQDTDEGLRKYLTVIPGDEFTEAESQRLFSLWFEGYEDMTVAEYQEKMWKDRDKPADMELIERYSLSEGTYQLPEGREADALAAFNNYFFNVYEPLTGWTQGARYFSGEVIRMDASVEYSGSLDVTERDTATVGSYEQAGKDVAAALSHLLDGYTEQELLDQDAMNASIDTAVRSICSRSSTAGLAVDIEWAYRPNDTALHAQASSEAAAQWDRLLTPYVPFGLTYSFDDPDLDGNGLTMWFEGKEVRSITDEQEGLWITEHTGISAYSPDAIDLYTVYTDGVLTGLRLATDEEQAVFTEDRVQNSAEAETLLNNGEEQREFPNATRKDYDSFLTLKTPDYADMALAEFNQRLLDWANENPDAYDRINCDVIWNDYAVSLTDEEKAFVAHTCRLSGNENGVMIRALYTGQPEEDPSFAATLPMLSAKVNGVTAAWCDLYYDICYHISDKSTVTVGERDHCAAAIMNCVADFWQVTDIDTLLSMSEDDIVSLFNVWASKCGTDHVSFCHVTGDHVHYECADERHIYNEYAQSSEHHPEPEGHHNEAGHHSDRHHG